MTAAQVSKPYAHAGRWRCRKRTEAGWRWCPAADSPEAATAAAQTAQDQDHRVLVHKKPAAKKQRSTSAGGVRLQGPHPHAGGYRYRLVSSAGRQWAAVGSTEREALKLAERAAVKLEKLGETTIADALASYLDYKESAGARPNTVTGTRNAIVAMFRGGAMAWPIWKLTPRAAQAQYDRLRETVYPKSGRPPTAATHRNYLTIARTFCRWLIDRGWMRDNSFEKVRGVGKRRRGKKQLTLDEARRLIGSCLKLARQGDDGATAVLLAIAMGLRASEVLSRTARDLDNGGTVLRVDDNDELDFKVKNDSSARSPEIPEELQPILSARAAGKRDNDPLFAGPDGKRRGRYWLRRQVKLMCGNAGVPEVCTHALRGSLATALAASGVSINKIAGLFGHSNVSMTKNHYIAPGVAEAEERRQGLAILTQRPQPPALPC